jgi:hypothetical protein
MTGNPYLIGLCEVAGDLSGSIAVLARCRKRLCTGLYGTARSSSVRAHRVTAISMGEDIMG